MGKRLVFGLFVLMVSLHAYYFACWLFIANKKTLALIGLKDFMVVRNR